MKIRWLDDAVHDLQSLRRYIAQEDSAAANRVVYKILRTIELLSEQPAIGRPGRVSHTRELVISSLPYIIPYRVRHSTIEVLRVLHCSMQWPESF